MWQRILNYALLVAYVFITIVVVNIFEDAKEMSHPIVPPPIRQPHRETVRPPKFKAAHLSTESSFSASTATTEERKYSHSNVTDNMTKDSYVTKNLRKSTKSAKE